MVAPPPGPLHEAFHAHDAQQRWVNWLFSRVADRYDLGNDLMSAGWHTRWKERLVEYAAIAPHHRVLDLACGTGDVTFLAGARAWRGEVIGSDLNAEMIAVAERKRPAGLDHVRFELGDAAALPYPDASFDRVTCAYAGRGFPSWPAVIREVARVLVPGGHFWNLDFARPPRPVVDRAVRGWLTVSGAVLGAALHGDPRTYTYIPASMRAYRGQRWLADELRAAGLGSELIETRAGLMAYNHAWKPNA